MSTDFETLSAFNQPHLDRVSRSFAHGIRQLAPSLRAPVGLGYLICRLLDTVEDASWEEGSAQERAFATFEAFIAKEPKEADVRAWAASFPLDVTDGERVLLEDAPRVFREYHRLMAADRAAIEGPVLSMSRGMNHFMARKRASGVLKLANLGEVQSYCFFVAGVVGELLTGLLKNRVPYASIPLAKAGRFGLFLQKVNILKDQRIDESQNRFLVPVRRNVLRSLMNDAREAMSYLESVPLSESRYRIFCAWALLLGLASIPAIEKGYETGSVGKIPRLEALWLANRIEAKISDEKALRSLFEELWSNAFSEDVKLTAPETPSAPAAEVLTLYRGSMADGELVRLLTSI